MPKFPVVPGQNLVVPGQNLVVPGQNLVVPGQKLVVPGQKLVVPGASVQGMWLVDTGLLAVLPLRSGKAATWLCE